MHRIDTSAVVAFCASLLMHSVLALIFWACLPDNEVPFIVDPRQSFAIVTDPLQISPPPEPEALPLPDSSAPQSPPAPPPPPEPPPPQPDEFGEDQGRGTGAIAAPGDQPMQGRKGPQDQPWLSRDPPGPGRMPDEPSMSTALPGMNGDGRPRSAGATGIGQRVASPSPAEAARRIPVGVAQALPTVPRIPLHPPRLLPPPAPPPAPPLRPVTPPKPAIAPVAIGPTTAPVSAVSRIAGGPTTAPVAVAPTTAPAQIAHQPTTRPVDLADARRAPATQPVASAATPSTQPAVIVPAVALLPPPRPPGIEAADVFRRPESSGPPQPSRAASDSASGQGPGGTGPAGRPMPAADPAPMADSESDAFSRVGSAVVRAGRLDVRLGRKVKPVKPRLPLKGEMDLISISHPSVLMKVSIADSGDVTDVSILKSSGSNEIDLPARLALYRWWIEPLKGPDGKARPDVILLTLTWY